MKRLLLLGAGHAHAQVLLDWARAPLPGVEITVVSPLPRTPYSGMVPGWLAGRYTWDEITIDFAALCAHAGARWLAAEVQALDPSRRTVQLDDGSSLGWDLLSLNIGSTLRAPTLAHGDMLPLRPLSRLHDAWDAQLARLGAPHGARALTVTAVGGGAAGVESLLAVLARLRRLQPDRKLHGRLVSSAEVLLPGLASGAVRHARRALAAAGVEVHLSTAFEADGHTPGGISGIGGISGVSAIRPISPISPISPTRAESELVLWATGAEAHDLLADPARRGGLAVSERGYVRIDRGLRSVSHPHVFAVGDCADWAETLPKAGVFAVRMGPVLAHNLRAALGAGTAQAYHPQRRFLVLLDTSDGAAIASRGVFFARGLWAARWKESIDRRFVARFAAPAIPRASSSASAPATPPASATADARGKSCPSTATATATAAASSNRTPTPTSGDLA